MSLLAETQNPAELGDRLRDAHAVTAELMADVIGETYGAIRPTDKAEKPLGSSD